MIAVEERSRGSCDVCGSPSGYRSSLVEVTVGGTSPLGKMTPTTLVLCERHAREVATELAAAASEAACRRVIGYAMEREE